ncbi:hypothetical protein AYO43_09960 [Nitrospira sp. SCGC AG-212-E16]|nr:hypothetical protein AYO43_09960 [Nitrospira sp. SCGC AG-212-E16]
MSKETGSNPTRSTMSASTPRMSPNSAQAQDRIALRAYALYEQRGRQEGLALEDWVNAERELASASSK